MTKRPFNVNEEFSGTRQQPVDCHNPQKTKIIELSDFITTLKRPNEILCYFSQRNFTPVCSKHVLQTKQTRRATQPLSWNQILNPF